MYGIESANRLGREWTTGAIHDFRPDSKKIPMCRGGIQARPPAEGQFLRDFLQRGRTNQNAVAFNQCQI